MPKLTRKRPYVKVPEPEEEPAEDSASEFELPQSVSNTDDDDSTVTSGSETETRPPKVPKLSKHDDGLKRPPKSKSKKDKESDKGLDGDNADNNSQDVASSDNADKDFSQDDVPEKWRIPQLPPMNKANWSMETFRQDIKAGLKLLPGAFQNFTPNYGRPRHITDYPEIRGYRLDLDQLQLYNIRTTGTLKLPGTGSEVPVWRIVGVWRRRNQKTESIEYFVRIPSKTFPKRNGITTSVCPTEEDAARLGNLVVDYTNRCPSDFSDADWASQPTARPGGTSFAIYARAPKAFCEVTALLEYNKDLDLAQTMGPDWITGQGLYTGGYGDENLWRKTAKKGFNLRATAKSSIAGAVDLENDRFVGVKVALSTQPVPKDSKAAKLPPTPMAYRPFFRYGTDEATTASKKQQQTFHEHTQASHFGHIGNKQQFSESWNQRQLELGAAQLESRRAMAKTGPLNKQVLFHASLPIAAGGGSMWLPIRKDAVVSALHIPASIAPKSYLQLGMLHFTTVSNSFLHHAYIRQSFVNSIARDEGEMRALYEGHMAAADVDHGLIGISEVLQCAADGPYATVCMHCPQVKHQSDMFVDEGGRILCKSCFKHTSKASGQLQEHRTIPIARRIRGLLHGALA